MILILHIMALSALWLHAPTTASEPVVVTMAAVLGGLLAWRGAWALVHLARALLFRQGRFPPLRRAADGLDPAAARPRHLYVVFSDVRMSSENAARCFRSVLAEAIRFGGSVTVVVGPVEVAKRRLIKHLFHAASPPERVLLVFVCPPTFAPRATMSAALRAVLRANPPADAAVVLIAHDTIVPRATFERSLPFLGLLRDVDLIMLDERASGRGLVGAWSALQLAQRHQIMSSLALSGALDTVKGGAMVFRAGLVPRFVRLIERTHHGPGRARGPLAAHHLIWLGLLRGGCRMMYLPDVAVVRIADPRLPPFAAVLAAAHRRADAALSGLRLALAPRATRLRPFLRLRLLEGACSAPLALLGLIAALGCAAIDLTAATWTYGALFLTAGLIKTLSLTTAHPHVHALWPLLVESDRILLGWALFERLVPAGHRRDPLSSAHAPAARAPRCRPRPIPES